MSEEPEDDVDEAVETPAAEPKRSKRKKIIIGAAAALLLLGGGGGGAYMFFGASGPEQAHAEAEPDDEATVFVDVPSMIVNLRSADGAARFVKLHFMLVPGPQGDVETLTAKLPLLLDAYQPFLRELRPEDLAGSAAVFRIKEELLVRAADVLGPERVKDVLIQDLIQQ